MKFMLHTPKEGSELSGYYERAFENAVELFIVTAFLTDWDADLKFNRDCGAFRLIIGKDFGITKKVIAHRGSRLAIVG